MYTNKYKYVRGEDNKRLLPLSCTLDTSSANISSGPMGSDKRATVFANIRQHDGTRWDRGGGDILYLSRHYCSNLRLELLHLVLCSFVLVVVF